VSIKKEKGKREMSLKLDSHYAEGVNGVQSAGENP